MDPDGTPRDDLDVRLHWPGAEPDAAADEERPIPSNGASRPVRPEVGDVPRSAPPEARSQANSSGVEADTILGTLSLISARIDSLASAVEGMRVPFNSILGTALDRLEHAVTALTRTVTGIDDRTSRSLHEVLQRTEETAEQLEALRRRVALRARGDNLSPEAIDQIAAAVTERLSQTTTWRRARHT
jgi:ABC-type transporter Mla subunit MlaD